MTNVVIVGAQWGDEGKGKIVDLLSHGSLVVIPDVAYPLNVKYDVDVRYNGAHNAGHTVKVRDETYKLHHIPSGIVSGKECIIGNGLAVNPKILIDEIEGLEKRGISTDKLCLSSKAHVIFPYHEIFDGIGGKKIGTTKRGVGPAYEDKSARRGIRVEDLLLSEDELCEKIEAALEDKNFLLEFKYG
ncbi:MAG: adenylosuccinate synthetase [Candidatus Aenigmatarchaeota archaeon]|nr:MAG: adenylosuccinate synthetase [Candidatus Aenigmarchaeota archaeon]